MNKSSEESEIESDAGASPSVWSDSSVSVSSRSPSPGALRIICESETPKKKGGGGGGQSSSSQKGKKGSGSVSVSVPADKGSNNGEDKNNNTNRRKRQSTTMSDKSSPNSKRTKFMNKRRWTKSERNTRAGKVRKGVQVAEEDGVALDAEIDKFLEEKAMKNNLTATNVKSIIRHVITNNMVQKLIMSTMKKKTGTGDSSDDEWYEPKLTRARSKMLSNTSTGPLWPLASPAKPKPPVVSETHVLINEELPEDSSGDEEYVPNKAEETHSDDESSSLLSVGSPAVSTPGSSCSGTRSYRRLLDFDVSPKKTGTESCFKTPPPVQRPKKTPDSAIGQRTRSKLPLNDTPLEELEMQLIPPDITTDMYDWGLSDNEDYLSFLKEFLQGNNKEGNEEGGEDDEADPEYNIMEEEEEHDKEELRRDRAVKVTKKELNALFAELLEESHFPSGDELDEGDFTNYCASQLSTHHVPMSNTKAVDANDARGVKVGRNRDMNTPDPEVPESLSLVVLPAGLPVAQELEARPVPEETNPSPQKVIMKEQLSQSEIGRAVVGNSQAVVAVVQPRSLRSATSAQPQRQLESMVLSKPKPLFDDNTTAILEHQLRQHVQLLAQSYALTATREENRAKVIAQHTKRMIIEMRSMKVLNGQSSVFSKVVNCDPAWQFVTSWPAKCPSNSPIKKKILVEHMNESNNQWPAISVSNKHHELFPRPVAQAIAESDAFIYPELLPMQYDQTVCNFKTLPFTPSEDVLLILAADDLKDIPKMNWLDKANAMSKHLLTPRSPKVVYTRIRNLRKKEYGRPQVVVDYFEHGVLPHSTEPPFNWDPSLAVAPIRQPRERLPNRWAGFISLLMVQTKEGQCGQGWKSQGPPQRKSVNVSSPSPPIPGKEKKNNDNDVILHTFPKGTGMIYEQLEGHPELTAIPIYNVAGIPEVYVFVPQELVSPQAMCTASPRKMYHPVPFHDITNEKCKALAAEKESEDTVINLTPVGKPVDLPGVDSDVIDLSNLNTPLKQALIDQLEERADTGKDPPSVEVDISIPVARKSDCKARSGGRRNTPSSFSSPESRLSSGVNAEGANVRLNPLAKPRVPSSCSSSSNSSSSESEDNNASTDDTECVSDGEGPVFRGNGQSPPVVITIPDEDGDEVVESDTTCKSDHQDGSNKTEHSPVGEHGDSSQRPTQTHSQGSSRGTNSTNNDEKDDDGNGDDRRRRFQGREIPEDHVDDGTEREDDTEEDVDQDQEQDLEPQEQDQDIIEDEKQPREGSTVVSSKRKAKSSQRGRAASPPKKRVGRGVPVEEMLKEDPERDQEVCDAFMEVFLSKVKTSTEASHPGLHSEFLKLLSEGAESLSLPELVSRVRTLLNDFPHLLMEFCTFLGKEEQKEGEIEEEGETEFHNRDLTATQINFIEKFEKFTEKSSQLRAKLIQKMKSLDPNLPEKEIATALAPYFQGNPVISNAFQAIFPSVDLPGSVTEPADFEDVDMENENVREEPDVEFVQLPAEKNVPATTTCPCDCHTSSIHAYSSRIKHCKECCIKFGNDGKVYAHHCRISKQVNVEVVPPAMARKMYETQSKCSKQKSNNPYNPKPQKPVPSRSQTQDVKVNISATAPSLSDTKEEITPQMKEPKPVDSTFEISDQGTPINPSNSVVPSSENSTTIVNLQPWSFEEDKLLLTTCKLEKNIEDAFPKLELLLQNRDRTEIESRCVELLCLLQQTIGSSEDD